MKKPVYLEIVDNLKSLISSNKYISGHFPIPTEINLCERFNVSRETIRKSILFLVNEGYLYRIKKLGTFVNSEKVKNKVQLITWSTYHNDKKNIDKPVNVFMKKINIISASKFTALEFGTKENQNYIELERVLGSETPEVYFKSWFNPKYDIFFTNEFINFKWESLYEFIELNNLTLEKSVEQISAKRLEPDIAQLLQIQDLTTPIIVRERKVYESDGTLVEINIGYYNADKVKYEIFINKK